jgi:hypothetical protein
MVCKDVEGEGRGLFEELIRRSSGQNEENHDKYQLREP